MIQGGNKNWIFLGKTQHIGTAYSFILQYWQLIVLYSISTVDNKWLSSSCSIPADICCCTMNGDRVHNVKVIYAASRLNLTLSKYYPSYTYTIANKRLCLASWGSKEYWLAIWIILGKVGAFSIAFIKSWYPI